MAIRREIDKDEAQPYHVALIIAGLFVGMSVTYLLVMNTFITLDAVFGIFFILGTIVFGIHYLLRKRLNRYIGELIIVSFAGYALLLTAIFLLLNYLIHDAPVMNRYALEKHVTIVVPDINNPVNISVSDPMYKNFNYMLDFEGEDQIKSTYVTQAWITTAKGVFGYRILLHKELH